MKASTTIATVSGLVSVAAAQSAFGVIASHSASAIHLQSVNANGLNFWIGKETTTYQPEQVEGKIGNGETLFAGGQGTLGLSTNVPGGQQVYVAPNGEVKFTQAHSANAGQDPKYDGWSREELPSFGELYFQNGVLFCPETAEATTGPYKMFAALPGLTFADNCLGASLITTNSTGPGAWQYV